MSAHTDRFTVRTHGKGTTEITRDVAQIVARSGIQHGTVTVFVCHTSASLVIMENADPDARIAPMMNDTGGVESLRQDS